MSTAGKTIDIPDLINNNKIGSFQIGMLILCGLCVIMDGFDVQAMGYVAPAIIADWHVSKANLGPVFGAGLLGMLVGSLVFSITADKFGRRPVLIGSTIFFSLCMLVTPLATNIEQLQLIRFITGLGLGAVMPNAMALAGEYSPLRKKVTLMMLVRLYAGRRAGRIIVRRADSRLRLAIRVLRGRRGAARDRRADVLPAAGIDAIPGIEETQAG